MSFVGKKNSMNEIKMKEKIDENLKVTINDKIFEIMTRNNSVKEKLEKINQKNYILREDEEYLEKLLNEIKSSLESIKSLLKDFDSLINKKYSNEIDLKDKLNLIKGQMCKTIDKEIENFNKNASTLLNLKSSLSKKTDIDYSEDNLLIDRSEEHSDSKYKVGNTQIKYYDDISKYRKGQIENIYSKVLMVQKITDEINLLTHQQDKKIEKIDDNIEPVLSNAKEAFKKLLEASNEEKNFKNNNCCIIFIIILAVFFLVLVLININRE